MKFISLLKKEIKELLTPQVIIGMIGVVVLLQVLGGAMGGFIEEVSSEFGKVTICNNDDTLFTNAVIDIIRENNEVTLVEIESDDYAKELERLDLKALVIIPEGFSQSVMDGKPGELITVSKMTSLSSMAGISSEAAAETVDIIKAAVKVSIYAEKGMSEDEILQLEMPVSVNEVTVVADKHADVAMAVVQSVASMQGMFVPIVIFVLVMYAAQMIMAAISTEKIDKTLETLLSAPVSRLSVLTAKMTAAGIIAALNAIAYMFGFNGMMKSMTGNMLDSPETQAVITELGLSLAGLDYVLLGIQMFLTILISLSIALILGALAKDAKSAQTLLMPIMVMAMIPYFVTMMMDIKTLPAFLKIIVYAIPFTHTFTATENIMLGNMDVYTIGLIYQVILLIVCMFLAVRLIMTDRIFTMTIEFGKKKTKTRSGNFLKTLKK